MAQTKEGAKLTRARMIAKYGSEGAYRAFMGSIGAKGGKLSSDGGFASEKVGSDGLTGRQRASIVGAIGGKISRRKKDGSGNK